MIFPYRYLLLSNAIDKRFYRLHTLNGTTGSINCNRHKRQNGLNVRKKQEDNTIPRIFWKLGQNWY